MQKQGIGIRSFKVGAAPGSMELPPGVHVEDTTMAIIDFDGETILEQEDATIEMCRPYSNTASVSWINIVGLKNTQLISDIAEIFLIHPLALEDIVNTGQRPKVDEYEEHLFIVLKMLRYDTDRATMLEEQISIILGPRYVLTFQEAQGDVFDPIRERIRKGKGRVRRSGPDYLAYVLVDIIVDNYFFVVEHLSEKIEVLENEIFLDTAGSNVLDRINALRQESNALRRHTRPMREMFARLEHVESPLIKRKTLPYLRDVYDHAVNIADLVEGFRDTISGMVEHHRSSLSTRMNEVMKFLTIIGTIFIPLTFIAGIYGMNFDVMPELHWRFGYPLMMSLMVIVAVILLFYFRRKRWL